MHRLHCCRGIAIGVRVLAVEASPVVEASPEWQQAFACQILQTLTWRHRPNFPDSGLKASHQWRLRPFLLREGFAARFPLLSFPYSGLEASRLRSICIAGRTYATLHVRCEDRAMKNQNQICNTYETGKKGKINTHKWEIRETKWATQSICQHCKLYTPTTTHHTRKHISRKCHTWHCLLYTSPSPRD